MTNAILRKRVADVQVGDLIVTGSTFYRVFAVRAISDAGFVVRERRRQSSHPHRLGQLISSKEVRRIRFEGRIEMCESRTYDADQWVSILVRDTEGDV